MKDYRSSVEKMLVKKALGYRVKENVEEYAPNGDGLKLIKKKVTTKHVSPDLAAAKALLELGARETDLSVLSDDELLAERHRLLGALGGAEADRGGADAASKDEEDKKEN